MKLTIITPSFNHVEFLGQTIDSVLTQAADVDLEYLVRDGGSTDGTIELLRSYGDRVRWLSEPDKGQVDAINRGLRAATGDIVGWLNSDDFLLPGALRRVKNAFSANPDTQWVFGDCIIVGRDGNEMRKSVSAYKRFQAKRYSHKRLLMTNFVSQMTVFWRRDLIDKVGLLDESLPLAFDYEYWLRLAAVGDPFYIDAPQAAFRWYQTSKSGGNIREQCREDELIAARHGIGTVPAFRKRIQNCLRSAAYRWLPS